MIHYWLRTGQLDRDLSAGARGYASRPPVAHKLDPCKGIIGASLEEFPKLSGKRLFDEVRAAGYPGGYKRVQDYVRTVRCCSARDIGSDSISVMAPKDAMQGREVETGCLRYEDERAEIWCPATSKLRRNNGLAGVPHAEATDLAKTHIHGGARRAGRT